MSTKACSLFCKNSGYFALIVFHYYRTALKGFWIGKLNCFRSSSLNQVSLSIQAPERNNASLEIGFRRIKKNLFPIYIRPNYHIVTIRKRWMRY